MKGKKGKKTTIEKNINPARFGPSIVVFTFTIVLGRLYTTYLS